MRGGILPACALLGTVFATPDAEARVLIHINLSSQTMHVRSESGDYDWRISTARDGYRTPHGTFRPEALLRMHYSRKYHMSPMPYSIFFAGGYAIHGTYETGWLGRPVSHGCVRLAPGNAALLFQMVKAEGAQITITGSPPHGIYYAAHRKRHPAVYARQQWPNYYGWQQYPGTVAYTSSRRPPPTVRAWQTNPAPKSLPQWLGWP